ncbi:MAG: 2-C-methyl-D-erythritol 2,4-cyclodiphosphate synthase [Candidatus Omnitrophica bacterium]|jgi:2-C-methyl-D-erythritol 2,4-cyclodiphosphate synthase|nr:2-C-methyl-D-erythritol 2,4-cyclodiphosphate synthase [Candidatus Omnitrophota bacterium]
MRIGFGYDIHRFADNRELWLGGIKIPYDKGLLGHSDADVLLHAVCDALLGASGEGDIGKLFPDTDPKYKDISSIYLLEEVVKNVSLKGFVIENIDVTVICEMPKIGPYSQKIEQKISDVLSIDISRINIKAKTNEKIDAIGTGEAIAVHAVCLLS